MHSWDIFIAFANAVSFSHSEYIPRTYSAPLWYFFCCHQILKHGTGLSTGSDSELITQLLAFSPPEGEPEGCDWPARYIALTALVVRKATCSDWQMHYEPMDVTFLLRIKQLISYTPLAYSLLVMHKDTIYAVRDPFGNRPLCIGKLCPVTMGKVAGRFFAKEAYIALSSFSRKLCWNKIWTLHWLLLK